MLFNLLGWKGGVSLNQDPAKSFEFSKVGLESGRETRSQKVTTRTALKTWGFDRIQEVLEILGKHGVEVEHLDRLRNDQFFAHQVGDYIAVQSRKEPAYHNVIRSKFHLGNFFGIAEWQRVFGTQFSPAELGRLAIFPWDTELLNSPDLGSRATR